MPYWKWTPQNCTLDDLDAEKFCHLVEGKKGILFVGERAVALATINALPV